MVKVKYSKERREYRIKLPVHIQNAGSIFFKFDTGASDTVISLPALIDASKINEELKQAFLDAMKKKGVKPRSFGVANGTDMDGYKCSIPRMIVGSTEIIDFQYYLLLNVNKPIVLLGDDFISCCHFEHCEANGDIEIKSINAKAYQEKHLQENTLNVDDIASIMMCVEEN